MTKNNNVTVQSVSKHVVKTAHVPFSSDNECGNCGVPCSEQDDFCSPRCERTAQGGKQAQAKRPSWDG